MALSGRREPVVRKSQSKKFNPRLIFSQIVAIQCFHYLCLGLFLQINHLLFGTSISLSRIFSDKYLGIWTGEAWCDTLAFLVAQIGVGSLLMAIVVEKSKKCLDFGVTLFLIHWLLCTFYDGAPKAWQWYAVHILGTISLVLLGEYLCSRKELDEIPLLQL